MSPASRSRPEPAAIDWRRLIELALAPREGEHRLAILVDLPDTPGAPPRGGTPRLDHPGWRDRRRLAAEWWADLHREMGGDGFEIRLYAFANAGTNNGDLPARAWRLDGGAGDAPPEVPADHAALAAEPAIEMEEIFAAHDFFLAPTELSATAPLKVAARRHGFRAATLPGFSRAMVPALALDFLEVDRRCRRLAELLDAASMAHFTFEAGGERFGLRLDLRHRLAHVSSGILHAPGTAGNLPSGETYIVPYEGELPGDPSRSEGFLPVELGAGDEGEGPAGEGEVVIYRVLENRAVGVRPGGQLAAREAEKLRREPAYGNLAELGLGVLADLGIHPIGEILLDEKLGLHIAFGRSEHFGGQVGPGDFSSPGAVVHIDRVYLRETQPGVAVLEMALEDSGGGRTPILRDGRYVIRF
ncbi:MAG: hypothetical protein MI919_08690 [Holophagales bacterium]|nr:hypothetical protein [Holophagales bacterium]